MFGPKEKLDDDLIPYLEEDTSPFPMLRHPLVYAVPYWEEMNHNINAMLRYKRDRLTECRRADDASGYVFAHERPYRFHAMKQWSLSKQQPLHTLRPLVQEVWQDSENIWQHKDEWLNIIAELVQHHGTHAMTPDRDIATMIDHFAINAGRVTIYRGVNTRHEFVQNPGLSWTLNVKKANMFANRFAEKVSDGAVLKAINVTPAHIGGMMFGRGEQEVILRDPGLLNYEVL